MLTLRTSNKAGGSLAAAKVGTTAVASEDSEVGGGTEATTMGAAIEEIIDVEAEAALEATRPPAIGWLSDPLPAELFLWARFRRAAAKDEADDVDVVLIEAAEVTIADGGRGGGGALAVNKLHFLRRHFVLILYLMNEGRHVAQLSVVYMPTKYNKVSIKRALALNKKIQ